MAKNGNGTAAADADLPAGLSKPALRALAGIGCYRLEQVAGRTEKELLGLHGMGPKGIETLRRALADKGMSFKDGKQS